STTSSDLGLDADVQSTAGAGQMAQIHHVPCRCRSVPAEQPESRRQRWSYLYLPPRLSGRPHPSPPRKTPCQLLHRQKLQGAQLRSDLGPSRRGQLLHITPARSRYPSAPTRTQPPSPLLRLALASRQQSRIRP